MQLNALGKADPVWWHRSQANRVGSIGHLQRGRLTQVSDRKLGGPVDSVCGKGEETALAKTQSYNRVRGTPRVSFRPFTLLFSTALNVWVELKHFRT